MAQSSTNGRKSSEGNLKKGPRELFADSARVQAAVNDAMRDVRLLHKRMGVGLVGWKDGKIVEIPPEEIQIDDAPPAAS